MIWPMTTAEFVALVKRMRNAQRAFYAADRGSYDRSRWFEEAKKLEREVDRELGNQGQGKLFE